MYLVIVNMKSEWFIIGKSVWMEWFGINAVSRVHRVGNMPKLRVLCLWPSLVVALTVLAREH